MSRCGHLDLLLINPGNRTQLYQTLGSTLAAIEPPVWASLMASFVRKRGFSVAIVDADAESLTPSETAKRIVEMDPLLVAVAVYGHQPSASTQNMTGAGAICTAVKQAAPNLKTLLVGGHVAALPERSLRDEEVDFVCGGEGAYTLLDLLRAIKDGERADYSKVRDLYYWKDRHVVKSARAPLVTDLEGEMPGMAWDLLPMDRYRAHNWHCFGQPARQPYAALYTTLGCPYRCSFCCIQAPFKSGELVSGYKDSVNSYRFWSTKSVIAQIDELVNRYGVRNIKIADEMFVLNTRHVLALCDSLIERGYDLNIWAYARVDTIRPGMLEKLKAAGVNWLALGIEAASEEVRVGVEKGFDQDLMYATIEKIRAAGLNIIGNFIFGLPEDDSTTMQQTLDLAVDLNCEFANFYSAMAYPGSQLYAMALEKSWALPETWSGYSQHSENTLPLPTKYLRASEVLRFRDHAFNVYFSGARYLDMITQRFGPETAQHLRSMTAHRLRRKWA